MERYSQEVFARTAEIDNAFKNIDITFEYLAKKTHTNSNFKFSEHHAFHVENFLLRLTSVVDRSYLLAGSTMLLENSKIEKLGGKKLVHNKISEFSPESFSILKRMEDTISHLKGHRNKVAHQSGYSNKNLCILQAIENSDPTSTPIREITEIISYESIKNLVITDSTREFQKITSTLDSLVTQLIDSLSFVYSGLLKNHKVFSN